MNLRLAMIEKRRPGRSCRENIAAERLTIGSFRGIPVGKGTGAAFSTPAEQVLQVEFDASKAAKTPILPEAFLEALAKKAGAHTSHP
jgi:hypothetical protein